MGRLPRHPGSLTQQLGVSHLANVPEFVKAFMRRFPQGVTIVATSTVEGPSAMTVGSFTSVSLSPPLVLCSISKDAETHPKLMKSGSFSVNLLGENQSEISQLFASADITMSEKFRRVRFKHGVTGSPIIEGVVASMECRVWRTYEAGDHTLFIGEVVGGSVSSEHPPLVYHDKQYRGIRKILGYS